MHEKHIQVATADGQMETFVAHPAEGGPFPAVVLYMDAPGIREELRGFARRIAAQGYVCVLPDLYYRHGRVRYDLVRMTEADREDMFTKMRSLTNATVLSDTESLLTALESEDAAAPGAMGCIGYCMSGQYVMSVAGTFPERFRASVSCYGVGIVTDREDTPHRLAPRVAGEIFFAFAEHDAYVPDGVIETLAGALSDGGADHDIVLYPDTEHGFCFPERPVYREAAAEDVWSRSFAMFARQLKR
jgi:carboxymethylenebutenolidase